MTTVQPESTSWAETIAAELHRIADDFAKTDVGDLPMPRSIALNIQPGGPQGTADDQVIGTVDALGLAVLGKTGKAEAISAKDDTFHYNVEGRRGPIAFAAYREVSTARVEQIKAGAVLAEKEAELERLRAEVEKLRAERCDPSRHVQAQTADARCFRCGAPGVVAAYEPDADPTGLAYSREADDPATVSGARVEPHVGAVTEAGLVDETEPTCLGRDMDCGRPLPCPDHPKCTPDCDALTTRPEITGMDRGYHHDDCPVVPLLEAADRARLADEDD